MTLTVNNVDVTTARIALRAWGVWWADVTLAEPAALSGKVTIAEQESELKGTIISGGVIAGGASYRIAGGGGGWRKEIKAKGYQNAAGCTFSSVSNELASEVGETLENPPRTALGPHYARPGSAGLLKVRAADVLSQHFPRGWHVGDDGVTRFVPRTGDAFKDESAAIEPATELGMIRVSADYGTKLRPGITIDGKRIGDVDLFYAAKRVTAYCYPDTTIQTDLIGQIAERVLARTKFLGCYEYKANDCDAAYLLDVEPVDSSLGLPTLDKVLIRPPAGYRAQVADGDLVVLSFLNGNPARPIIIGCAEADSNDSELVVLGQAGSADFVALAGKTDQAISDLKTAVGTGFTAVGAAMASNGANGKTAFDGAAAAIQSVAAQNVKVS